MSTATITQPAQETRLDGEPTVGGYAARIIAYCMSEGIELSPNRSVKLGRKMEYRAKKMQAEFDLYEALRILGISSNPTARQAENRATSRKLDCEAVSTMSITS